MKTILLLVVATVFWGANFNLAKHVFPDLDAPTAAAVRFGLAAFTLWGICRWQGRPWPRWRDLPLYAGLGLVGIACFNGAFFYGLQFTSASNGALIMGFNPLLTALLSALVFGVRLRRQQWLAMPIGVMGVGFVVLGGGPRTQVSVGDLWVLFGCFCWAIYNATAARLLPRDTSGMTNTASVMTMGALGLCAWALWQGQVANGLTHLHAESALSLLVITFGGTVLSYIFWNQGLASMGAPRAAMFMNLVPVSSLVFSVIEGKGVSGVQLVGGAAVMGAVMLASWNPNAA